MKVLTNVRTSAASPKGGLSEHIAYPKGFRKIDQATICEWIKKTSSVEFASFLQKSDRNVKYSPFEPKSTTVSGNSGSTALSEGTSSTPTAPAKSGGSNNGPSNSAAGSDS